MAHGKRRTSSNQLGYLLQEINYDSARGGVSVITEKGDITTSYLLIQRAKSSDSGQYTCSPSNSNSKSVNVHILAGEFSTLFQSQRDINTKANWKSFSIGEKNLTFNLLIDRWHLHEVDGSFALEKTWKKPSEINWNSIFLQVNSPKRCTAMWALE